MTAPVFELHQFSSFFSMAHPDQEIEPSEATPKPLQQFLQESTVVTASFEEVEDFAFAFAQLQDLVSAWRYIKPSRYPREPSSPPNRQRDLPGQHHLYDLASRSLTTQALPHSPAALHLDGARAAQAHRIDALLRKFSENYPAEILSSDAMPSICFLSLVHEGLKSRLSWVP